MGEWDVALEILEGCISSTQGLYTHNGSADPSSCLRKVGCSHKTEQASLQTVQLSLQRYKELNAVRDASMMYIEFEDSEIDADPGAASASRTNESNSSKATGGSFELADLPRVEPFMLCAKSICSAGGVDKAASIRPAVEQLEQLVQGMLSAGQAAVQQFKLLSSDAGRAAEAQQRSTAALAAAATIYSRTAAVLESNAERATRCEAALALHLGSFAANSGTQSEEADRRERAQVVLEWKEAAERAGAQAAAAAARAEAAEVQKRQWQDEAARLRRHLAECKEALKKHVQAARDAAAGDAGRTAAEEGTPADASHAVPRADGGKAFGAGRKRRRVEVTDSAQNDASDTAPRAADAGGPAAPAASSESGVVGMAGQDASSVAAPAD